MTYRSLAIKAQQYFISFIKNSFNSIAIYSSQSEVKILKQTV